MSETHLFGLHAVEAVLRRAPERVKEIWLDQARHDQRIQALLERAREAGVRVSRSDRERLDQLSGGGRHQGAVAQVREAQGLSEGDLERILVELREPPFLLLLDGVQDPHNLGACLRTADAAGLHAVIAPRDRACGLNATVRKVASGAAETIPFVQVTNLARSLRMLAEAGVPAVGAAGEGELSLYQADLTGPLALVLGAEGKGMRRLTREQCERLVHIPMRGSVESLNVSVAAGICLYEALRQRGG